MTASTADTKPLSTDGIMEKVEEYLVVVRKRAYSTVVVPFGAIAASLLLTGNVSILLDWILLPILHWTFRIVGTALGIGLGLGLATHVYDCLETWHTQEHTTHRGDTARTIPSRSIMTSTASSTSLRMSFTASNVHVQEDETSYAALMTLAGYDVSNVPRRGQIVKQTLSANYPYTSALSQEDWKGVDIMKQQWPHLPSQITHMLGMWIEYIMRDYVAIWYCMIDSACPYQDEREKRRMEQEQQNASEEQTSNNGDNDTKDSSQQQAGTSSSSSRQMVFTTAPHRPLPLMTAMYHSLALVLGNLTSRVEHTNVFSLVLLKFTRVLALKLKTYRELRVLACDKNRTTSSQSTTSLDDNDRTIINGDASSSIRRKRRRPVHEMTMTKEFLLAGKLHRAVTFGLDVPSLLFADASGKECPLNTTTHNGNWTEEQVLEQRLIHSNMLAECEGDYNRVLAHRLVRALLPRSEFSSPIVRTLMTEMLAGCILSPIMACFSPDYVNSWISSGLETVLASSSSSSSSKKDSTAVVERQWEFDENGEGIEVGAEVELEAAFNEVDGFDHEDEEDGMHEAIEAIRSPTNVDDDDENLDEDNHDLVGEEGDETRHDLETVSGDYILPLLTMAIIDLQRFFDFTSPDPEESGTNWDDSACQDAVRQVVLVVEAALIHGRRRQRLTTRKRSMIGDDAARMDHEGDTLLPFFSSNLSQVLMELTSDIDAFGARIAMEEARLKNDENAEKANDSPSKSCKPPMSELSTLRTLIAAWLHTGQVYKMLSVLIQARQSILIPYFHQDAFLRNSENAAGFVSQLRALDGVEIIVDTTSILASSILDDNGKSTTPSPQKRAITIQVSSPSGSNSISQPSPRAMASSLSQSMARRSERLQRFMSGATAEDIADSAAAAPSASSDGPTPRYLDFHRNKNFALSLRTERERRSESWLHVSDSMADQSLKIVHRVKGASEEDMEDHRDLHRLSRTFYSGTNMIVLKDGTRRKQSDASDTPSSDADTSRLDNEIEVDRVSLITVEMVGAKRRIEIPDDDSSFLIRAQVS